MAERKSLEERFWGKVDKRGSNECWEWTGAKSSGYGGIRDGKKVVYAHRVSWELHNSPIPDGLWVLHHCDNRGCVNPGHLFLGTKADNVHDMMAKGRGIYVRGEANGQTKLTEKEVHEIRTLLAMGKLSRRIIGEMYGVSQQTISCINTGSAWGWLEKRNIKPAKGEYNERSTDD